MVCGPGVRLPQFHKSANPDCEACGYCLYASADPTSSRLEQQGIFSGGEPSMETCTDNSLVSVENAHPLMRPIPARELTVLPLGFSRLAIISPYAGRARVNNKNTPKRHDGIRFCIITTSFGNVFCFQYDTLGTAVHLD